MFHLYKTVPNSCIELFGSFETIEDAQEEFAKVVNEARHMSSYNSICEALPAGVFKYVMKLPIPDDVSKKWAMIDEANGKPYDSRESKCYR